MYSTLNGNFFDIEVQRASQLQGVLFNPEPEFMLMQSFTVSCVSAGFLPLKSPGSRWIGFC